MTDVNLIHLNKEALSGLVSSLKRYKVTGQKPAEEAEKKNNTSEMVAAFRKAKAEGKKIMQDWPDIELRHRAPAAKGGTQIVKTTIKKSAAPVVDQTNNQ